MVRWKEKSMLVELSPNEVSWVLFRVTNPAGILSSVNQELYCEGIYPHREVNKLLAVCFLASESCNCVFLGASEEGWSESINTDISW